MKISIESTDVVVEMAGVTCRVWRGETERGTKVELLVPLIRVAKREDCSQLDRELQELTPAEVAKRAKIYDDVWSSPRRAEHAGDPDSGPIDLRQVL